METIKELPQVFSPASHIFIRIVDIPHIHPHGGLRHQLHEPDCAGSRNGTWIKV